MWFKKKPPYQIQEITRMSGEKEYSILTRCSIIGPYDTFEGAKRRLESMEGYRVKSKRIVWP